MIFCATDNQRLESVFARDATEESPQIGSNVVGNQVAALFRRKDAMHKIRNVCVRHAKASVVPFDCAQGRLYGTRFHHLKRIRR